MKEPPPLPFLARPGYRFRRLIELIRLLPFVGFLLFMMPLLWATRGGPDPAMSSSGSLYIFVVWLLLIIGCAIAVRAYNRRAGDEEQPDEDGR